MDATFSDATAALPALRAFVRIPSVSGDPRHAADVARCAGWLVAHLRKIGLEHVSVHRTPRHPIVTADWLHAPGRPTLLLYGHYDVQPAGPAAAWSAPPFAAEIRGDRLYGRGATDDKGQIMAHLAAIAARLARGPLPLNLRCLFEGEEEIGSPNLKPFLLRYRERFAVDAAVVSDTRMLGPDRPAITYGLRGGLAFELTVRGPARDLHSGNYGGAVHNPIQALCELIAALHDRSGRIAIPGLYRSVRSVSEEERAATRAAGPSGERLRRDAGVASGWGERGYTHHERTTIRPALTVNGITGGHQGPGGMAVIPAVATAKLSFRLVPDQDPGEIERLLRARVAALTPPTIRAEVRIASRVQPALLDRRHPAMRAAARAYERGFGRSPVFLRSGGSIPVVSLFADTLGIPTVLMGFALPDANIHAPDEHLHLPTWTSAIATCAAFYDELARSPRPAQTRRTSDTAPSRLIRSERSLPLPSG